MDGPTWTLPEYQIRPMAAGAETRPWHIYDFGIDRYLWPNPLEKLAVGIVDTGASRRQTLDGELRKVVVDVADFTGSVSGEWDRNGHGTHVAGIIGSATAGVARGRVELICAKAMGDSGSGDDRGIARALQYCADKGAKLINMSLGSPQPSPTINDLLVQLMKQGVLVVVAAGNDGGKVNWPAKLNGVLAVSAIDRQMRLASFSCRGPEIRVTAPGVDIVSLGQDGGFVSMSGTSMAAPWATGYIACAMLQRKAEGLAPFKSVDEVAEWMQTRSTDLGDPGADWLFGVGLPDPSKFLQAAPATPAPGPAIGPKASIVIAENGVKYAPTGWQKI